MNSPTPPPMSAVSTENAVSPMLKRRSSAKRKLLISCCVLFGIAGIGLASATWWYQHNFNANSFKPVQLSLAEQAEIEEKVAALEKEIEPSDPAKTIVFNEREINGYLQRQGLGESVKVNITKDGIGATVLAPMDESLPFVGGHTLRLKVAFNTKLNDEKRFALSLADVSVGGISLPNAWLGNVKGLNLLDQYEGQRRDNPFHAFAAGIKSLTMRNGEMRLVLND